jgi:2-phosphoglycerate kinase
MGNIMLITDAPAVGKSTIAHAVASQAPKSIHIRVDQLREIVVSGIALPTGIDRHDEATQQFRLARTQSTWRKPTPMPVLL